MKSFNIAIIEDNQDEFFRLREQIRLNARYVDKIYACRFESEFYELLNWRSCNLIIVDNEIKGRPNAGLKFINSFYNKHPDANIFGFLYTWGTDDYNKFRIQIHSLNQNHTHFLGAIFKQIGDYGKIIEIIKAIHDNAPLTIFDKQLKDLSSQNLNQRQRELNEMLMDLNHRIQERLIFCIQMIRYHLEQNINSDFSYTLKEFSNYTQEIPKRYFSLKRDLKQLLGLIENDEFISNTGTINSIEGDVDYLKGMLLTKRNGNELDSIIKHMMRKITSKSNGKINNLQNNDLQSFLIIYDEFISRVSRIIETAQIAVNSKTL